MSTFPSLTGVAGWPVVSLTLIVLSTSSSGCESCSADTEDGDCSYVEREATCSFNKVDGWSAEAPTAEVTWRASVPNIHQVTCEGRFDVAAASYDDFVAELKRRSPVPCLVEVETGGACPAVGSCRIRMAPLPGASWAGGASLKGLAPRESR